MSTLAREIEASRRSRWPEPCTPEPIVEEEPTLELEEPTRVSRVPAAIAEMIKEDRR